VTRIRLAEPQDAHSIATIHVEAWKAAYRGIVPAAYLDSLSIEARESTWQQNLMAGRSTTWVAQESETIVGWSSAAASRDADASPSTGEIWAVYVDPTHWGAGVGRSLCANAERHLLSGGSSEVTLWVLRDNERAVRFYRSCGFVLDIGHQKTVERGGKSLVEIRFRKPLPYPNSD
jgi:ribosomal protein S18 acetylase RimI-like enzyme